ncbi:hypothetical protein BLS_001582 [Venturia inaequalis]|uniref:Uncharacterized protein n=1 Tax=Venturia inaequalis TaxID=5025 RepID=A0A8H3URJ0_VENIN|nr:hypothetical protein EG328_004407 [Venturia inaequalis]KAE9977174.1 hypothetical protein BLS_001582 [Venturia inaequalis]KAE9992740.1 hypothetical protein EG327_007963 [Venturia inaequalis]RDI78047.1 26S proteasome regulatory subunit [Venturia inaequalis]
MKFTFTLLVASLATSVSAKRFELCCCLKHQEGSDYYTCDKDATKTLVDAKPGHYAFTSRYWWSIYHNKPIKYESDNYIYATGKDGEDTVIGKKEMQHWCDKQKAGYYCFSPGFDYSYNYKGEFIGTGKTPIPVTKWP